MYIYYIIMINYRIKGVYKLQFFNNISNIFGQTLTKHYIYILSKDMAHRLYPGCRVDAPTKPADLPSLGRKAGRVA